METTTVRKPSASDEGACGTFINLFRRQHPTLARLAHNSNAYHQPMVATISSSAVGIPSITSAADTVNIDGVSDASTLDATIGRIHNIPQLAMSRLTGSPTVYAQQTSPTYNGGSETRLDDPAQGQ